MRASPLDNMQCLKDSIHPGLKDGDVVAEGHFYRNLKDGDPRKRFGWDGDKAPIYGRKIHHSHWKNAQQMGAPSVNQVDCIRSPACSLLLDNPAAKHKHVAEFDLQALADLIDDELAAQYKPVGDGPFPNPCHFELIGNEGDIAVIMKIRDSLDELEELLPVVKKAFEPDSPEADKGAEGFRRNQRSVAPALRSPWRK